MAFDLSAEPVPAPYVYKEKSLGLFLKAYEMGSLKLQDPTGGLLQQEWTLFSDGTDVFITSPTQTPLWLFRDTYITEIDLAFDQNMYPFICYTCVEGTKFRWFDPSFPGYVITTMTEIVDSPRCTLDDKRAFNISNSNIVLAYIDTLTRILCYRLQSDRYSVVYPRAVIPWGYRLRSVGFSEQNRLQFEFDDLTPAIVPTVHRGLVNRTRPISVTGAYIT